MRVGFARPKFVEQAPDENGRMVDVLPDEVEQLVARRLLELWRAVDFVHLRNFRPDQDAGLVAQAVEIIAVLVMRAADARRADFLDERNVLVQVRVRNRPALVVAILVFVHAMQGIRLAVQEKSLVRVNRIRPQAQRLLNRIHNVVRGSQFHHRVVKIRILAAVPQMRMRHRDAQPIRRRRVGRQHD